MKKAVRVSSKGQVVIPVEIRRKFNIKKMVSFKERDGKVYIEPVMTMEDAFGIDGEGMYEVAREISRARRKEIELEG
ncbi:MAG: AbrB/MazE/SpoVT family DNA-binding domain-containing protein [Candidatus Nitrosotenuis sp.]